jgi:hypothetical protein
MIRKIMKHPTIRTNELPTRPESHCEETPSYQKESGIGVPPRPLRLTILGLRAKPALRLTILQQHTRTALCLSYKNSASIVMQ